MPQTTIAQVGSVIFIMLFSPVLRGTRRVKRQVLFRIGRGNHRNIKELEWVSARGCHGMVM